jgi:hypothetical protein
MNTRLRGEGGVLALASYWQESKGDGRVRKRYERGTKDRAKGRDSEGSGRADLTGWIRFQLTSSIKGWV